MSTTYRPSDKMFNRCGLCHEEIYRIYKGRNKAEHPVFTAWTHVNTDQETCSTLPKARPEGDSYGI